MSFTSPSLSHILIPLTAVWQKIFRTLSTFKKDTYLGQPWPSLATMSAGSAQALPPPPGKTLA